MWGLSSYRSLPFTVYIFQCVFGVPFTLILNTEYYTAWRGRIIIMKKLKSSIRFILIDIAGFGLLLLVPVLGPLPGPGGIPLVLAALGLLSINHEWARQLRAFVMKSGGKLTKKFFPDRSEVKMLYDLLTILLASTSVWMWFNRENFSLFLIYIIAISGAVLFALNRSRADRVDAWFKRKFSKSRP